MTDFAILGDVCRCILIVTFGRAAFGKLRGLPEFARSLSGTWKVSPKFSGPCAVIVIVTEFLTAAGLCLGPTRNAGATAAIALTIVFSLQLVRLGRSGISSVACGCFGGGDAVPLTFLLARNTVIGSCAIVILTAAKSGQNASLTELLPVFVTTTVALAFGTVAARFARLQHELRRDAGG